MRKKGVEELECPFCGAEAVTVVEWKDGKSYDYACGTEQTPGGLVRGTECYETELTRKNKLLRKAGRLLNQINDWIYVSSMPNRISDRRKQLYDCIFPMEEPITAFLTTPEVVKVMEEE